MKRGLRRPSSGRYLSRNSRFRTQILSPLGSCCFFFFPWNCLGEGDWEDGALVGEEWWLPILRGRRSISLLAGGVGADWAISALLRPALLSFLVFTKSSSSSDSSPFRLFNDEDRNLLFRSDLFSQLLLILLNRLPLLFSLLLSQLLSLLLYR